MFRSPTEAGGKSSYLLTWTVDSYSPIKEYRLLYRQIQPYHKVNERKLFFYPDKTEIRLHCKFESSISLVDAAAEAISKVHSLISRGWKETEREGPNKRLKDDDRHYKKTNWGERKSMNDTV